MNELFIRKRLLKKNNKKNDLAIALNVLYVKKEKIHPSYVLKHNSKREKLVILLMIRSIERWHYIAVKELSALLRGTTSRNNGDFYCLKIKIKNKDFYNFMMPSEGI